MNGLTQHFGDILFYDHDQRLGMVHRFLPGVVNTTRHAFDVFKAELPWTRKANSQCIVFKRTVISFDHGNNIFFYARFILWKIIPMDFGNGYVPDWQHLRLHENGASADSHRLSSCADYRSSDRVFSNEQFYLLRQTAFIKGFCKKNPYVAILKKPAFFHFVSVNILGHAS